MIISQPPPPALLFPAVASRGRHLSLSLPPPPGFTPSQPNQASSQSSPPSPPETHPWLLPPSVGGGLQSCREGPWPRAGQGSRRRGEQASWVFGPGLAGLSPSWPCSKQDRPQERPRPVLSPAVTERHRETFRHKTRSSRMRHPQKVCLGARMTHFLRMQCAPKQ